jgi:hypothetical protein
MRKPRLIVLPLAVALSAGVASPAVASQRPGPPTWPTNPTPITAYSYQRPGPPTWPANPTPIAAYHTTVQASGGGFDWDSAAIGAAASTAILAAGLASAAGVHRRRGTRPQRLTAQ